MSETKPEYADLPVWAFYKGLMRPLLYTLPPPAYFTHWRPAEMDIPSPPKEETQEDRDLEAFHEWRQEPNHFASREETWLGAIAYERAEVAQMLPYSPKLWSLDNIAKTIEAIRARCEGGAK